MDGLRWQELFYGAEKELLFSDQYTKKAAEVRQKFWHQSAQKRARELMPFFWNTLIKQGLVVGDRRRASEANITNEMGFSSPGYHEILAGFADPDLVTNASEWNKHVTLLEWAEKQPGFGGRVAAFGSWNKLAYVLNTKRATAVYHNYAHEEAKQTAAAELTATEHMLNQLQRDIPARWRNVRNDAFTHHYALEYIKKAKPRLVHIAYGETDDFAHDGRYDEYLSAAYLNDRFIGELWNYLQTDPHYRGKTTLLITTDHGRGHQPLETWQHHATAKALKGYQKHLAKYGDIV
ncbi:MAG: phosphoglyceromutase, partial [Cellvibrionaceae bacterium]|nr:phosphoglyceromutase [Cellvibrionaceae bacterium]